MKIIGIIAVPKKEEFDTINRVAFEYAEVIEKAGAIPIIIPCNIKNIDNYIKICDSFLIPGGEDIDPSIYEEENNGSKNTNKSNDEFLINFLKKIILSEKPVLGICKGMQLINVYLGGSLTQDIKNSKVHYNYEEQYNEIDTAILNENSFLSEIFKSDIIPINSIHHQAVNELGLDLDIVARSKFDDTIEAIEHKTSHIYGVQWHPECLKNHQKIFDWFVKL